MNQRAVVFLTCILVSVAFWFITSMGRTYETHIPVPVSYRNVPFTKNLEGDLPKVLEFHFKGTGFELFGIHLRKRPDSIVVDMTAAMDKNGQISISSVNLKKQFPGDLQAFKITPEIIAPGLISRSGKRVPVELQAEVSYRERFRLSGNIILRPDSIDIAGPPELLKAITSVQTEKVVLSDIHKNHFAGVYLSKNLPKGIQLAQPYIHYYVPVAEYTEASVEIPVELPVSLQRKLTLLPSRIKVIYEVELGRYHQIKPDDFVAYIDFPFGEMPSNLEVKLKRKPAGIMNVRISPGYVDYLIKE